MEFPSLEVLKRHIDMVLGDKVSCALGSVWLTAGLIDLRGHFQPKGFYGSVYFCLKT